MSAIALDVQRRTAVPIEPPTRRRVPRSRSGPGAKPQRGVGAPSLRSVSTLRPRGCAVAVTAPPVAAASWRLTDRGLALVLVLLSMIIVAAVAVVGLTALRVTGPEFLISAPVAAASARG